MRTLAPLFTRENAAEMARRASASRVANIQRRKQLDAQHIREGIRREVIATLEGADAMKLETIEQIKWLDRQIKAAMKSVKADEFLRLTAAKERLWKLVNPTGGVLKQSKRTDRARPADVAPVEPASE